VLGTRAGTIVDLTWLVTLLAPLVVYASTRLARRRRFDLHRRVQIAALLVCWAAVLALEVQIRVAGGSGSFVEMAPQAWQASVRWLLLVHIAGAVVTYLLWSWLAIVSSRRFGKALPGAFSPTHRRLGWWVLGGLGFTAASASAMYLLAFVL
jgi:putative membrane protein